MLGSLAWTLLVSWMDRLVPYLPVLGLILIVLGLFFSVRKRRQTPAAKPTAREELERSRQEQGMRDDLQSLMVEIEQMAKRLSSQIDSKTVRLEKLLSEADRKIERLEQLTGTTSEPSVHPHANGPPASEEDTPQSDPHQAPPGQNEPATPPATGDRAARTRPEQRIESPATDAQPDPDSSPTRPAANGPAPGSSDDPLTRSIYELADAGKAAQQIAAELNEHVGKVELILALRRT